jgi:predicted amidohydrolase YtcJ
MLSRRVAPIVLTLLAAASAIAAEAPADAAYRNAVVFTAAAEPAPATAFAVRAGRIVYVGDDRGLAPFVGKATEQEDLGGRFVMPGLVDGHMHPLEAGLGLLKCSLEYRSLTVAELQQRVRACLDAGKEAGPDEWLQVVAWFQENMRPTGVVTAKADLDALGGTRPILIRSSFGHTSLVNSRALLLAGITRETPDPIGGRIWRDARGEPTGLLEDSAQDLVSHLIPLPTPEQNIAGIEAALKKMASQGVTSFLDAAAEQPALDAFTAVHAKGGLTARAHFAILVDPKEASDPAAAAARVAALAKQYDGGAVDVAPGITVRNAKLFMDGVIAAPALTGAMLEPYLVNAGSAQAPRWVPGPSRGPDTYFPAPALAETLTLLARAGIDPHMHADGDAGVRAALDAVQAMRRAVPGADIRPAIAHAEIVAPSDMPRFAELGVQPVLSFQWGKPAGDTLGLVDIFGPERMAIIEPSGALAAAGARLAFGSDWPVDALDEWFALKVAVTRANAPDAGERFAGRLGKDPGLGAEAALRAATIDSSFELHQDTQTGSIEPGKIADFIVLDRNPLAIAPEDIANVRVLRTVVGGKTVYSAP